MDEPGPSRWLNRDSRVVAMTSDEKEVGAEWLEAVMKASEGDHGKLSRACFGRDQLELVRRYLRICARLESHGAKLLTKDPPLVPIDFPISPLPNTRLCIAEGIERSFALFCRHLHELTLTIEPRRLAHMTPAAMSKLVAFVNEIACELSDAVRDVMDHVEVSEAMARERVARRCADFAVACVEAECARLRAFLDDCDGLERALRDFLTKRQLTARQLARFGDDEEARIAAKARVVRTWAAGVLRRGHGEAPRSLLARPVVATRVRAWPASMGAAVRCIATAFARLRCGARDDDENADNDAAVYGAIVLVGEALADVCTTEAAAAHSLLEQGACGHCWSTLAVEMDDISLSTDHAPLLQAPGHLAVFSRGRLRVRTAPTPPADAPQQGVELAGVRLARAFETLLRERHLPFDRLGADYANRIIVCEYVKYERAVLSIEAETLEPLGEELGIPYFSTVPDLATARRAQQQLP